MFSRLGEVERRKMPLKIECIDIHKHKIKENEHYHLSERHGEKPFAEILKEKINDISHNNSRRDGEFE